jgi:gliding motility-associated-like protein
LPTIVRAKANPEGDGLGATYTGNCQNEPTLFQTQGVCSPMASEASWDFGDGSTGKGLKVSHTYTKTGTYTITLKLIVKSETALSQNAPQILKDALREFCKEFTFTDKIYIKPSPEINLANEIFVCIVGGQSKLITPIVKNTVTPTYKWQTSSGALVTPTLTHTANAPGNLVFEATNTFSNSTFCKSKQPIEIKNGCDPILFIPEAFSPNGDTVNDDLKIVNEYVTNFILRIYNRWGEIIFESNDANLRWDGTYKGKTFAPGIYAYYLSYQSTDFPNRPPVTKTGGVMILR